MKLSKRQGAVITAAAVAALAGGGAAIAGATGGSGSAGGGSDSAVSDTASGGDDGNGQPITGSALDHAKAVALHETGGGTVTGTEVRDEEGYYEIEVQTSDGSRYDVHLDRNFNLIDKSPDGSADSGQ